MQDIFTNEQRNKLISEVSNKVTEFVGPDWTTFSFSFYQPIYDPMVGIVIGMKDPMLDEHKFGEYAFNAKIVILSDDYLDLEEPIDYTYEDHFKFEIMSATDHLLLAVFGITSITNPNKSS